MESLKIIKAIFNPNVDSYVSAREFNYFVAFKQKS